jgi:hypothetical protein
MFHSPHKGHEMGGVHLAWDDNFSWNDAFLCFMDGPSKNNVGPGLNKLVFSSLILARWSKILDLLISPYRNHQILF